MTLFLYLYLIHFLADYAFQTSALVKYKTDHFLGVILHTTVHLVALLVVLSPFMPNGRLLSVIAIIYVTHIMMDQSKVTLNKAHDKYIRLFYFLDQAAHLSIATACAYWLGPLMPKHLGGTALALYTNQMLVLYLLTLVLSTYFYDVTCYFVRQEYLKKPYIRDYRTMLMNAGIVTVAFGVYWLVY